MVAVICRTILFFFSFFIYQYLLSKSTLWEDKFNWFCFFFCMSLAEHALNTTNLDVLKTRPILCGRKAARIGSRQCFYQEFGHVDVFVQILDEHIAETRFSLLCDHIIAKQFAICLDENKPTKRKKDENNSESALQCIARNASYLQPASPLE